MGGLSSIMGGGASFPITSLSRDRIIVITGASSGLGYEIAKWCAMMGATVILACRSEEKTRKAIDQMNEEFQAEKTKGTRGLTQTDTLALEYMHVELSSFKSVVKFTEEFKKSGRKLHVLFLNAGRMSEYRTTEDGLETVLQVNYLSQFLMTTKLLPIMLQSGEDCRILLMSSFSHKFVNFDRENMNYTGSPENYADWKYYMKTKLYQIMQMFSMVRRLDSTHLTINSINPGVVNTNIDTHTAGLTYLSATITHWFAGMTSYRGALSSIDCATNPDMAGVTGVYFDDFKRVPPSSTARNEVYQEELWNETWRFIKDFVTKEDRDVMEGKCVTGNTSQIKMS